MSRLLALSAAFLLVSPFAYSESIVCNGSGLSVRQNGFGDKLEKNFDVVVKVSDNGNYAELALTNGAGYRVDLTDKTNAYYKFVETRVAPITNRWTSTYEYTLIINRLDGSFTFNGVTTIDNGRPHNLRSSGKCVVESQAKPIL